MSSTLQSPVSPRTAARTWSLVLFDLDGTLVDAEADGRGAASFPGIVGLLEDLCAGGIPLGLVSSGSAERAERVLVELGLRECFEVVLGQNAAGSLSEAELVAAALERLAAEPGGSVLVADRAADLAAAAAHGVPTILVEWGYGSPAEAEGALAVVHSVDGLRALLLG